MADDLAATVEQLQAEVRRLQELRAADQDEIAELRRREAALVGELAESREQQTTTAEILRVIASAPSSLQRVLDTVTEHAARMCGANDSMIFRLEGNRLPVVAVAGPLPKAPIGSVAPVDRDRMMGRVVLDHETIHVVDMEEAVRTEFPGDRAVQQRFGTHSLVATPLLREGVAIGAVLIRRFEVRPFTDTQIKLLETFADQAVIAIENARLFEQLQHRVGELQALGAVGQALSSSLEGAHDHRRERHAPGRRGRRRGLRV